MSTSATNNVFTSCDTRRFRANSDSSITKVLTDRTDLDMRQQRFNYLKDKHNSVKQAAELQLQQRQDQAIELEESLNAAVDVEQQTKAAAAAAEIQQQQESLFAIKHLGQRPKEFSIAMLMLLTEGLRYQRKIHNQWIDEQCKGKTAPGLKSESLSILQGETPEEDNDLSFTTSEMMSSSSASNMDQPLAARKEKVNPKYNPEPEEVVPEVRKPKPMEIEVDSLRPLTNVQPSLELYKPIAPHDTTVIKAITSDVQMLLFPPKGAGYPPQQASYVINQVAQQGIFQSSRFRRYRCVW